MTKISTKIIQFLSIAAICIVLFFAYSILRFQPAPQLFSWPDEMANYDFASHFAKTGSLRIFEPLNAIASDLVHPRSTNVANHDIVPTGFLGMPVIWGGVMALFGNSSALYLTAILSIIALFCFYRTVALFFGERAGIISAVLLALQPAWWYYANFSMLPNVPFVSLLIIAAYFLAPALKSPPSKISILAGATFASLALSIRPNEIWWVAALAIVWFVYARKNISFKQVVVGTIPVLVIVFGYLELNKLTYGNYFAAGYMPLNGEGVSASILNRMVQLIFPFGVNVVQIAKVAIRTILPVHAIIIVFSIIGIAIGFRNRAYTMYSNLLMGITLYLSLYYLSIPITDDFTAGISALGNSSHRYLLPLIVLSIPLAAYGIDALCKKTLLKYSKVIIVPVLLVISAVSVFQVFAIKTDNLLAVKFSISQYRELKAKVLSLTPPNAVIITERADKWLYPERAVIREENLIAAQPEALKDLLNTRPVFVVTYASQSNQVGIRDHLLGRDLINPQALAYGYAMYEIK